MVWFGQALRQNPGLALSLSLAAGYVVGRGRIGSFQLGPASGTRPASFDVGQFVIPVDDAMENVFVGARQSKAPAARARASSTRRTVAIAGSAC
jgi:hypothetical protein